MKRSEAKPALPVWIFIVTDLALIGAGAVIALGSDGPLSAGAVIATVACLHRSQGRGPQFFAGVGIAGDEGFQLRAARIAEFLGEAAATGHGEGAEAGAAGYLP